MKWLKNRKHRAAAAFAAAILAVCVAAGAQGIGQVRGIRDGEEELSTRLTAWWGTLYPKFCFAQKPGDSTGNALGCPGDSVGNSALGSPGDSAGDVAGGSVGGAAGEEKVKISFWLAQVWDW